MVSSYEFLLGCCIIVRTSVSDCMEKIMTTCYVSCGTLNSTNSTHHSHVPMPLLLSSIIWYWPVAKGQRCSEHGKVTSLTESKIDYSRLPL